MLRAFINRLREWVAVEDAEERIEGSGSVILDPAYNGRYRAERELERLANVTEPGSDSDSDPASSPPEEEQRS